MVINTSYGPVWVSDEPPYFRDWLGRQAYKYRHSASRRRAPVADQR